MDQTRPDGGAPLGGDPNRPEQPPGGHDQRQEAPASNFPTFGQTPGWQDEQPAYGQYGEPRYGEPQYGHPRYQEPWYQEPRYDQAAYATGQGYDPGGYAGAQPEPQAYQGYGGAYVYGQPYSPATIEGGAVAALVLSILSWVFCPGISAVAALVVASNSKAKIRAFPERYTGLGLVTAARVVSWLNIGLIVSVGLLVAALIARSTS